MALNQRSGIILEVKIKIFDARARHDAGARAAKFSFSFSKSKIVVFKTQISNVFLRLFFYVKGSFKPIFTKKK